MQKHLPIFSFLFSIILSFNFLACNKEEEVKNYSTYPIDLKVEQLPNGGFKYSWNAINSSDFKEYWIVRNGRDSVPYININDPNLLLNSQSSIIAKITDASQTEIIDTISLFGGKTSVRIFAFLENRSLSSLNKAVNGNENLFEIKGNAHRVMFDIKNNLFYTFDLNSKQFLAVNAFNYSTNLSTSTNIDFTKELYLDTTDVNTLLYFSEFQFGYTTFSLPKFDIRSNVFFPLNTTSVAICRNKYIAYADNTFLSSGDKKNVNFINSNNNVSFGTNKNNQPPRLRWLKTQNQVLALTLADSLSFLTTIGLNENGFLMNDKKTFPFRLQSNNDITTPFIIAPNERYGIVDKQGLIIDLTTFKSVTTLTEKAKLTNGQYIDFTFSKDENFVYALRKVSISTDKKIDVFSYPALEFVKSISFKSKPKRMFFHDNKLKLVGESPNNSNFSMFEVINP
jgi:hypothetical protein